MPHKILCRAKRLAVLALALVLVPAAAGCGELGGKTEKKEEVDRPAYDGPAAQLALPAEGETIAVFDTSLGEIRARLFPEAAPLAAANFIALAEKGYYDGLCFHRSVYGFVVQSGDASGEGLSGRTIWGEPYPVEYSSRVHHYAGALCAAFSQDEPVSGSSQFYFVAALPDSLTDELCGRLEAAGWPQETIDAYAAVGGLPYLDNTDTVFGQVYEGMEVVDAIARAETDETDRPLEEITLNSVVITTYTPAPEPDAGE